MGGEKVKVDDAEVIRRFLSQMGTSSSSSNHLNVPSVSTPSGSPSEQCNGTIASNSPETSGLADIGVRPIDIPLPKKSSHYSTPSRNNPASPLTSPHAHGTMAPYNTPKTNPVSPFVGPAQTHDEDVGEALVDFVRTMDGKPLSESMWAPKSGNYQQSLRGGARAPSRNLTPTKVVDIDQAINDSFARMSFQAADSDDKVGHDSISERKASASSPNGIKGQTTTALCVTHEMEVDLLPMSAHGSVKAPHAAAKYYALANDEEDTDYLLAASPKNKADCQAPAPTKPNEKETVTVAKAVTGIAPHLRGGNDPQSFTSKAKNLVSQVFTATPKVSHPDAFWTTLPSPLTSHPTSSSDKGPGAEPADIATPSHAPSPVQDGLLSKLRALELSGSLEPGEQTLLTELTTRVLMRSVSEHTITASAAERWTPPARKTATRTKEKVMVANKPSLPSDFLSKWGTKPKDISRTRSNVSPQPQEATPFLCSEEIAPPGTPCSDLDIGQEFSKSTATPLVASKAAQAKPDEDLEDREHKTYFNAWPGLEKRYRPAAQIRKVIIKNLPANATPSFVASLVYFGPLEEIHMREGSAAVRFLDAADCSIFYEDAANGIVYGKDVQGREQVVFVELAKDVDVIGGLLRGWIDMGVTRCVRAVGVDEVWGMDALRKLGENKGRRVEGIVDGKTAGGARSVVWRFCKIVEAVQFKAALSRNEEWEHCNIHHAADPCATATGVHFEK